MKKKPFSELVIGLGCMALGVSVFIMSLDLQKVRLGIGPAGFPKFIAVVLGILGLAQTVTTLSVGVEAPKFNVEKKAATLFISAVAAVVVYVMLLDYIGFLLLTPILMMVMMWLFGERHFGKMALIAVVTTVIVWLLFTEVFMIFLPVGRIFA